MKKIATIAAVAALVTLSACGKEEAPAEVTATEAAATEAGNADAAGGAVTESGVETAPTVSPN